MKKVYFCSLLLSILHSILFWNKQYGISVLLFAVTAIIFLIYLLKKGKAIQKENDIFWSIPILLLSATYFIFNNTIFRRLNLLAIIMLTSLMIIELTNKGKTIKEYFIKFFQIIFRPIELVDSIVKDIKSRLITKGEDTGNKELLKKIVKSILIALPILIIVLALLCSADSIFGEMFSSFKNIFKDIHISSVFYRVLIAVMLFVYFSCFIVNLIKKDSPYNNKEVKEGNGIKAEGFTINTILVLLNVIYLAFSVIQFQNLFTQLGNINDLNFAQYARQGFFQLMFVSFINFAIIFVATINKNEESPSSIRLKKTLEILLILFTIVIIASSFIRMYLYEHAFGYTHLRLFVYVILITELISMLPVIVYILGAKFNLLKTLVIIVTTMYVGLNYINIDNVIAKNNIDRYYENEESKIDLPLSDAIDFYYLIRSTKTDAIPEITRLLKAKNPYVEAVAREYLNEEISDYKAKEFSWQEYNISVQRVKKMEK